MLQTNTKHFHGRVHEQFALSSQECDFASTFLFPRLLVWTDMHVSFRHISYCWGGARPRYPGLHRIIRDCPFACECVWQFGYSLFSGGPFCRNSSDRNKQHLTYLTVEDLVSWSAHFCGLTIAITLTLQQKNSEIYGLQSLRSLHTHNNNNNHRYPFPPVCPNLLWGWGISLGGAQKAITVIPSPSNHHCQTKLLDSKLCIFGKALISIFLFHDTPWFAELNCLHPRTPRHPPSSYSLNFTRD